MKTKLSIVIPCYKQANYLVQAIESILSQTIKPHEIIVVIDGSPDDSLQIAKSYESRGIRVINQVNKGLASARNTGIMWATGEFVLPLDSDDILLENCLEKIEAKVEETNADIVGLSFKEFGLSTRQVILMPNPMIQDFMTANRIGYCSAVRRSALLEVGGYNPKMIWGYEDYDLWFDLLKRGKTLVTIPEIVWLYRTKENSMLTESVKHDAELRAQIVKNHPEIFHA